MATEAHKTESIPEWAKQYVALWDLAKGEKPLPMECGDTEFIYQFDIPRPIVPSDATQIDGWDLPKEEQKFIRPELPDYWKVSYILKQARDKFNGDTKWYKTNPEPRQVEYAKREWMRRIFGYWFMNNGNPTYITGTHYMYLTYWILDGGIRPEYRDLDRRKFMYYNYCWLDPDCFGVIEPKKRREGATSRILCFGYDKVTQKSDAIFGNQSKTEKHARRNFRRIVRAHKAMPLFFKPTTSGSDDPKNELSFYTPSRKIGRNTELFQEEDALNSSIDFRSTDPNAYDTDKLYVYVHDEGGKVELCNIYEETWDVVKQTLILGKRKVGFAFWPSTVGGMDAKSKNTGQAYKKLAQDSSYSTKNKNNRTITGLYRLFSPAFDGYEGFIDEYGYSLSDEARTYLENEVENIKKTGNRNKINNYRRMYPFSEAEAFWEDARYCLFDQNLLEAVLSRLESNPYPKYRCNLEWENNEPFTKVVMRPSDSGRFVFFCDPRKYGVELNQVKILRRIMPDGMRDMPPIAIPQSTERFAIGGDPFSARSVVHDEGSKAAFFGYFKGDVHIDQMRPKNEWVTDNFLFEYITRPPSTAILAQDMIKACWLLGCEILIENTKQTMIDHFYLNGMQDFLMYKQIYNRDSQNAARMKESVGEAATPLLKEAIVDNLEIYLTDNWERMPTEKLAMDMLKFRIEETEEFDACMGAGYCLIAARKPSRHQKRPLPKDGLQWYRTYKQGQVTQSVFTHKSDIDTWRHK